jgi:hypothetical protein
MSERDVGRVGPAALSTPEVEPSELHVASQEDVTEATAREDQLNAILQRADVRDRAAEVRDRDAEGRDPGAGAVEAAIDRDWAGRDRDRAAEDRADLLALLRRTEASTDPGSADEPE